MFDSLPIGKDIIQQVSLTTQKTLSYWVIFHVITHLS